MMRADADCRINVVSRDSIRNNNFRIFLIAILSSSIMITFVVSDAQQEAERTTRSMVLRNANGHGARERTTGEAAPANPCDPPKRTPQATATTAATDLLQSGRKRSASLRQHGHASE